MKRPQPTLPDKQAGPKSTFSLYSLSSASDSSVNHSERLNELRKRYSSDASGLYGSEAQTSSIQRSCTTATSKTVCSEANQEKEQCIRGNLTPSELNELADIKSKLRSLKMPSTPETAFELFCSEVKGAGKHEWEALTDSD